MESSTSTDKATRERNPIPGAVPTNWNKIWWRNIATHVHVKTAQNKVFRGENATPGRGILKGFVYTFSIWNPEKTDEIPQDWMIYSWRCFIKKRIFICRKGIYVLLSLSRPYLPLRTQSWYPINPIFILWERYLAHEVFSILSWKISRARMPGNLIKPG